MNLFRASVMRWGTGVRTAPIYNVVQRISEHRRRESRDDGNEQYRMHFHGFLPYFIGYSSIASRGNGAMAEFTFKPTFTR
jgi:hypothetical protein